MWRFDDKVHNYYRCLQDSLENPPRSITTQTQNPDHFWQKTPATSSPLNSHQPCKVLVSEMFYSPGCVVSATVEDISRNKVECMISSLIPHFFSHWTITTIPIKDSRCLPLIKYTIYTIKYPIDPIKLAPLPQNHQQHRNSAACSSHPLCGAGRHLMLLANPSQLFSLHEWPWTSANSAFQQEERKQVTKTESSHR